MLLKTLLSVSVVALALLPALAQAEPWTYTDASGQTVTLDAVPTRIVAHQDAAAGLIPLGIRPIGIFADGPIADAKALQGLDLTGIEIVGQAWGEVDIEKVAALEPELIIGEWWDRNASWSGGTDVSAALFELAPITGPAASDSIVGMIKDYEALAASLGADLSAPEIAEAKASFATAQEAFKSAVDAKPNLTALAVYAGTDALYVADPAGAAELLDLESWGLNIVTPAGVDAAGNNYFETVSWENADKYPADLIMVDNRAPATLENALAQPTWTTLPAAASGAVTEWPAFWLRNYTAYAGALDKLTAAITAADENLTD
ncbi:iron complex transport system substrate-binding protein [Devosia sp. YR412]|uniref:ABC transporter substrate-binding protein n=1 Tax=Devosia sp. YR412 TaxID=1881030 RepID=UPI0008AAB334|nr:ABC transporter substrate-binding protein [Devosia sp. YR412]SEQ57394.1 iron complex transport system substrate-binding protein [Devosia sp. YR412]